MIPRDSLHTMIDQVPEADLDELHRVITEFAESKQDGSKPSLLSRLKRIKIEAPRDFSENFDLYVSGEKSAE